MPLIGTEVIDDNCHNPYFNRWFSAIEIEALTSLVVECHNPYFNRWFSAISFKLHNNYHRVSHNPYFNRWFSAITVFRMGNNAKRQSQSLF